MQVLSDFFLVMVLSDFFYDGCVHKTSRTFALRVCKSLYRHCTVVHQPIPIGSHEQGGQNVSHPLRGGLCSSTTSLRHEEPEHRGDPRA